MATSNPDEAPRQPGGWRLDAGCGALVLALGAALYARAPSVPWYLDDWDSIVRNPAVQSLHLALEGLIAPRGVAQLSFALNQALLGPDPAGFHAVNAGIHLVAGALVFALLRRLLPGSRLVALGGALVFVAHPLQTQAVTYAVQRMASLSALFFLASLLLFLRARDRANDGAPFLSGSHVALYLSSLLLAALAVLTKQNTVVFPFVFLVADRFFGPRERTGWRRRVFYLLPFFLLAAGLGMKELLPHIDVRSGLRITRSYDWFVVGYGGPGEPLREVTPLTYLVTEFSVLWKYLGLLVLPWGQAIDHGYPIVASCFTLQNAAAMLGLVALVALAILVRRRLPYLSFGIAFFLLALSVESTFFPLDTMVEHRLYLPMFGFVLALLEGLRRLPRRSQQALAIAATLIPLSALTWRRNALWTDRVAFCRDALEVHPRNPRLWAVFGHALERAGDRREAIAALEKALALNPVYPVAMVDLATMYVNSGRASDAEPMYRKALSLDDPFPLAHRKLGLLLMRQHRTMEAFAELEVASRLEPSDVGSLFFAALLANELGDHASASRLAARLAVLDAERAARVYAAIGQRLQVK